VAAIGALALLFVLLLRPMEGAVGFAALRPLESLCVIIAIGVAWERTFSGLAFTPSPQLGWLAAFLVWCFLATARRLGVEGLAVAWQTSALSAIFMVLTSFALCSWERLRAAVVVIAACLLLMLVVAVQQSRQAPQCVRLPTDDAPWVVDGRSCEYPRQCEVGGDARADYACERAGWFDTFTIGGRVRWRGQLEDPNELAVFIAAFAPFLLVGTERTSTVVRLGALGLLSLGAYVVFLTQSRGGALAFGAGGVLYATRRFGARGVLTAAAIGGPLVLATWRDGAEAESSSLERAEILADGLHMLRANWTSGVGAGQFANELSTFHTAHNTYVLIAAELGVFGYLLWSALVWVSIKIPLTVARNPPPGLDPRLRRFADALAMSLGVLLVGISFLSFGYKQVLFVSLGLSGALHGAVRRAHPDFRVRIAARDMLGIASIAIGLLVVVWALGRWKVGR
jgi:hypothetical protein